MLLQTASRLIAFSGIKKLLSIYIRKRKPEPKYANKSWWQWLNRATHQFQTHSEKPSIIVKMFVHINNLFLMAIVHLSTIQKEVQNQLHTMAISGKLNI